MCDKSAYITTAALVSAKKSIWIDLFCELPLLFYGGPTTYKTADYFVRSETKTSGTFTNKARDMYIV